VTLSFDAGHALHEDDDAAWIQQVLTQRENELQFDVVAATASSRCHFASMASS
jgi:hypothetical protein